MTSVENRDAVFDDDSDDEVLGSNQMGSSSNGTPGLSTKVEEDSEDLLLDSDDDDESDEDQDQIKNVSTTVGIVFCDECQTMMRPMENRSTKKLYYKCYHCKEGGKQSVSNIVSRNTIRKDRKRMLHIYREELVYDKTLSKRWDVECPNEDCDHKEAVMFLGGSNKVKDDKVDLVFMCCKCKEKWIHGTAEGEEVENDEDNEDEEI